MGIKEGELLALEFGGEGSEALGGAAVGGGGVGGVRLGGEVRSAGCLLFVLLEAGPER